MEEIGSTKNPSHCCVVGGGPGGVMLAYLLARKGVSVTLLEAHQDFDRDFRGDSLNSSVMEVMHQVTLETADGPIVMNDFSKLKTRFPFILLLPQFRFLEFIVNEAKKFSNFRLVMGANVQELIREDGKIQGVVYQIPEGRREVRANLIAGADGRA